MPRKPFRDTSDFGRKSQGTVDQCLAASNRKVSEVGIGVRGNMVDCMIIRSVLTVLDITEYWRCIDDTCIPRLGLRRLVTHRGGVGHRHAELGVLSAGRCYGPPNTICSDTGSFLQSARGRSGLHRRWQSKRCALEGCPAGWGVALHAFPPQTTLKTG